MDVEVNLSAAGRNRVAIKVSTTNVSGFTAAEVLSTEDAEKAVRDLQEALRAIRARRRPVRTRGKTK